MLSVLRRILRSPIDLSSAIGLETTYIRVEYQLNRIAEYRSVPNHTLSQVADLERLLGTANQRCVALEARLGLLEKELVEAEEGEVRTACRVLVVSCAVGVLFLSFM